MYTSALAHAHKHKHTKRPITNKRAHYNTYTCIVTAAHTHTHTHAHKHKHAYYCPHILAPLSPKVRGCGVSICLRVAGGGGGTCTEQKFGFNTITPKPAACALGSRKNSLEEEKNDFKIH